MPSCETRRSSLRTERKGKSGNVLRCGFSSAKASLTTRWVVACTRGLPPYRANAATEHSDRRDCGSCGRGRSPRGYSDRVARPCPWSWPGRACRPSVGSHSAGQNQSARGCRRCCPRSRRSRYLHAVIENLARNAADRRERRHVTAQNRLHVLVQDEAPPDQAAEAEHYREQPDDPCHGRLVGEYDLELGKIDLCWCAGRRLKANLEGGQWRWAELPQLIGDRGIAALAPPSPQPAAA